MIPVDRGAATEETNAHARECGPGGSTLPPPAWMATSAGEISPSKLPPRLSRRTGVRADDAWMWARIEEAKAAADGATLREVCSALARALASRERDLDRAVELAVTALGEANDASLRRELASWLESLGDAARAAEVLHPVASMSGVEPADASYALVRSGTLAARAGALSTAARSFESALCLDLSDALPAELLGALSAFSPSTVSPRAAAEAYVEAAARRSACSQPEAGLEDLWRAFAADATSEGAVRALCRALEAGDRGAAADEVWRLHAREIATTDSAATALVHAQRRAAAQATFDPVRALGAAFDEGLDCQLEGAASEAFDALLLEVGMLELLAARLQARADGARSPSHRAEWLVELARLYAGALAAPARAVQTYAAALKADPSNPDADAGLRAHSGKSPRIPEEEGGENAPLADAAIACARAMVTGDPRAQATALEELAERLAPATRALLLSVAAERNWVGGNCDAARRAAELATRAAPGDLRAVATLADVVVGRRDRSAAAALERAILVVGPRASWCAALPETLEALGENGLALGWRRWCVALRPGDQALTAALVERVLLSGTADDIAEALAWLLSQPLPASWLEGHLAAAIRGLVRLDVTRASASARRALNAFGPKATALREAMLEAATAAGDDVLASMVLERWLSCGPNDVGGMRREGQGDHGDSTERHEALWRLAALCRRQGDVDGEARVVARAAQHDPSDPRLDSYLEHSVEGSGSPDSVLWRLRTIAQRSEARGEAQAATRAWRDLGAALWDLAGDRCGAMAAWQRAAQAAGAGGLATMALDLSEFAGPGSAIEHVMRFVDAEPDNPTAASMAVEVARAMRSAGRSDLAFALAVHGLARNPLCTEALALAERAGEESAQSISLSPVYAGVASASLGRFGRRCAHYRAARFFERHGEHTLSLEHAAQAFCAVPSDGASFHLLAHAAERAGDSIPAVRAIEQVAAAAPSGAARAAWLLRAVRVAGRGVDGARLRVDLSLRAAAALPTSAALDSLREAARDLMQMAPEERDRVQVRVARAACAMTDRLDGPEAARFAIAWAGASLELFEDGRGALALVERAFAYDAGVQEYADLIPRAGALAAAPQARARTAALLEAAESPSANAGIALLRLIAAVGAAIGDGVLRARAAVAASSLSPDDDDLVLDADAAVRAMPELEESLRVRVPPARRSRALAARARLRVAEGSLDAAAVLFEQAIGLGESRERSDMERELRSVWDATGRSLDTDAQLEGEARNDQVPRTTRAERWAELADRCEARGDGHGAVRALREACSLDPDSLPRWSALERIAEATGDDDARIAALDCIATRVSADGQASVFKRLAKAHEARRDIDAAEAVWRRVMALDAGDTEADYAVETLLVSRGCFEELADHLALRAKRLSLQPDSAETLRALRLRRAAILEQRLGRVHDACDELTRLLAEWPDNVSALRYLADLRGREGDARAAATLWQRAAALEVNPEERDELELRAGLAAREAGDLPSAMDHAGRVLAHQPRSSAALTLRIEVARALGDDRELGEALDTLASCEGVDPGTRSDGLLEAARAAARAGDPLGAVDRARKAAELVPERAIPLLLTRGLEYRLRGVGTCEEAQLTIADLRHIEGESLGPDDRALHAFLLAEAMDVVEGTDAALEALQEARASADHPLLALAAAERLAARGELPSAIEAYGIATRGSLLGLRRAGDVAIAAADAALRAGLTSQASRFLDLAERYDDARPAVAARRAQLARASSPGRQASTSGLAAPGPTAYRRPRSAFALTPSHWGHPDLTVERGRQRLALAQAWLDAGDPGGAEPLLWEALTDGIPEAGDVLAPLLAPVPERTGDLVRVRLQQSWLEPGDVGRLEALRAAALGDGDAVHARAVEHVLRAFDPGAGPLAPPPLAVHSDQAGILARLTSPSLDDAGEALMRVWEGAMHLFLRDPTTYGITGIERVVPGPTSTVSRLYQTAIRMLDAPAIPLFVPRASPGAPAAHVAVLAPPAIILAGDVSEDSSDLRYAIGRGMSAALPPNVLRLGLPPAEGRAMLDALRAAFGTPAAGSRLEARVAHLAESFWQIIPARTQRRLQEILEAMPAVEYEDLVTRAHQSGRRVGMFLTGDFAHAARALLAESSVRAAEIPAPTTLRARCEQSPALADLFRLAVSPEYANARWKVESHMSSLSIRSSPGGHGPA